MNERERCTVRCLIPGLYIESVSISLITRCPLYIKEVKVTLLFCLLNCVGVLYIVI
jgi:hypothetical protein